MPPQLVLTVTRACNLRCTYCPTVKEGWPSLTADDARAAVRIFVDRFGGGDVKLFGGEPLLAPDAVAATLDEARRHPTIRRVQLSTNGLLLDARRLEVLSTHPQAVLTLSIDGQPADHRTHRRALEGVPDAYDHLRSMLDDLLAAPRVVVTMTIPPATAGRASANFEHLLELGFHRFNFLPGYFIPWNPAQLAALEQGFDAIAARIEARWAAGEHTYVRNIFVRGPTPFFNTGMVVDADRRIHPSNVGLSGKLESLLDRTAVGTLDDPPTADELSARSAHVNDWIRASVSHHVWASTLAVDRLLTRFVRRLCPAFVRQRKARHA